MLFLLLFLLPSVVILHVVLNCVLSRPAVSSPLVLLSRFRPVALVVSAYLGLCGLVSLWLLFLPQVQDRKVYWRDQKERRTRWIVPTSLLLYQLPFHLLGVCL